MNGIALSPLTMIRLPFLLGFFLLLTGSAPFADAASSGQEQGEVALSILAFKRRLIWNSLSTP